LFSYTHTDGKICPLMQTNFLKRLNTAAVAAGLPHIQGHSLRIGSVLEYLLRGLFFEMIKVHSCWSGDSYKKYLRQHATILAPGAWWLSGYCVAFKSGCAPSKRLWV
ncbi:hypothetical protein BDZ97DRAFT_1662973, partial [Flammula alnicola]